MICNRERLFKSSYFKSYDGHVKELLLGDPMENLWEGIRDPCAAYFRDNNIRWSRGVHAIIDDQVLSAQASCLNHLFKIRDRQDVVSKMLQAIDSSIRYAALVDTGFIEFSFCSTSNYLMENDYGRGARCTFFDAVMIGVGEEGERTLFVVDWVYARGFYNIAIPDNVIQRYHPFIRSDSTPFIDSESGLLCFGSFFSLMKKTMLAHQMASHHDYGCTKYKVIQVCDPKNTGYLYGIRFPGISTRGQVDIWKRFLKEPETFHSLSPELFLVPMLEDADCSELRQYLSLRYGFGNTI